MGVQQQTRGDTPHESDLLERSRRGLLVCREVGAAVEADQLQRQGSLVEITDLQESSQ